MVTLAADAEYPDLMVSVAVDFSEPVLIASQECLPGLQRDGPTGTANRRQGEPSSNETSTNQGPAGRSESFHSTVGAVISGGKTAPFGGYSISMAPAAVLARRAAASSPFTTSAPG